MSNQNESAAWPIADAALTQVRNSAADPFAYSARS